MTPKQKLKKLLRELDELKSQEETRKRNIVNNNRGSDTTYQKQLAAKTTEILIHKQKYNLFGGVCRIPGQKPELHKPKRERFEYETPHIVGEGYYKQQYYENRN